MLFRTHSGPVTVFRHHGRPAQTQRETLAIKNSEEKRPNDVIYQFLEQIDIVVGDVIQQQGSRDLWVVTDTEDSIEAGAFICLEARVRKHSLHGHPTAKPTGHTTITVQGGVTGGLVVNSPNTVQHVTVQLSPEVENACKQLRELLSDKRFAELDREDGLVELSRIEQLTARDKSPDVLERAKNRIESVRTILSSVQEIAATAGPWLVVLLQHFNK